MPRPTEPARPDPDAALMAAWQAGDEGAFERLVERHAERVHALLTRFLGPHPGREDLVQEVFLRIVRARDRYEPSARFTTWLYRIVFHLAVNETQRRAPFAESLDGGGAGGRGARRDGDRRPEPADEDAPEPSAGLEREDVVAAVRAAIDALPERQRMALVLARYDGLSHVEIGDVLDIGPKAVKSMIHRARQALRERLAPFLQDQEDLA